MTDPKLFLDGLLSLHWNLDVKAIESAVLTMAGLFAFHRGVLYVQRGKRVGRLPALRVERPRGWFKRRLGTLGVPDGVTEVLTEGFFAMVFLGFTYLALDHLSLPFKPLVPLLGALLATGNLLFIARSLRGQCVCYEKGLVVEGVYHSYTKVGIEPEPEGVSLTCGKGKVVLSAPAFEKNRRLIRDQALHVQFDLMKNLPRD